MSWKNIENSINTAFTTVNRNALVKIDPPTAILEGRDGLIEKKAVRYIEKKYDYLLRDSDLPTNSDDRLLALTKLALIDNQDQTVFNKGHYHFRINGTLVLSNDYFRHQSAEFAQYGNTKRLKDNIEGDNINQIKYFLPPEWQKAPQLAAEFHSAMAFDSYFIKEMIDEGIPSNQAKHILVNAITAEIELSANLRTIFNITGMRDCSGAQFETNYIGNLITLATKNATPQLANWLGSRCVPDDICREKYTCKKIKDRKEIYTSNLVKDPSSGKLIEIDHFDNSLLENIIHKKQEQIANTIAPNLTNNDAGFIHNMKLANQKYLQAKKDGVSYEFSPKIKFRSHLRNEKGELELEPILAENANTTFKRLPLEDMPSNFEFKEGEIDSTLDSVVDQRHYGVFDTGILVYNVAISRMMLQRIARHKNGLMFSSQHHTEHANFEYVVPPAIKKNPKMLEKYHTLMYYRSDLYARAVDAGIDISQARYCIPIAAGCKGTISLRPRNALTTALQRACSTGWADSNFMMQLTEETKDYYPRAFKKMGPKCMTTPNISCAKTCDRKDLVLSAYRDRNPDAVKELMN